jgi:hypothetical protein
VVVGGVGTPGSAQALAVAADRVYLVDGDGLRVIDVADPTHPWLVGSLETDQYASGVACAEERVLVGTGNALLVLDVSEPAAPVLVGQTEAWARAVAWRDGLAYASGSSGLQVFALEPDGAPVFVDSLPLPGYGNHIVLGDGCAYLSNHSGGLQVLDLADPAHPRLRGSTTAYASGAAVDDGLLWVAAINWLHGFPTQCEATAVADAPAPAALSLRAHPNPFNPSVVLDFRLPAPGPARLSIHDVRGRRLCTLLAGWQPAGAQTLQWDGRDDRGRALASGVYLVRLEAVGRVEGRRLVLLR